MLCLLQINLKNRVKNENYHHNLRCFLFLVVADLSFFIFEKSNFSKRFNFDFKNTHTQKWKSICFGKICLFLNSCQCLTVWFLYITTMHSQISLLLIFNCLTCALINSFFNLHALTFKTLCKALENLFWPVNLEFFKTWQNF